MELVSFLESRAKRLWLGIAGLAIGLLIIVLFLKHDISMFVALYRPWPGWAFIAAGLYLWGRHRMSVFLVLVGFAWFIGSIDIHIPLIVGITYWFQDLWRVVLGQTALSYPGGRLRSGVPRFLIPIGYGFIAIVGLVRTMAFRPYDYFSCQCPRNALGIIQNKQFFDGVDTVYGIGGGLLELILIVLLVRIYLASRGEERRLYSSLLATAGAFFVLLAVDLFTQFVDVRSSVSDILYFVAHLALVGAAVSYPLALRKEMPAPTAASETAAPAT